MTNITRLLFVIGSVSVVGLLSACAGDENNGPYDREAIIEVMRQVDQQADVIWGNSGSEWDADGERELFPTTDEGWQQLVVAGQALVTLGQDLKGYINQNDPRADAWLTYAAAISDVSKKLVAAAQEQDKKTTFDDGGVLYQVCTACHATFPAPEEE